jgi:uncharacterized protein (TIGR02145 family)/uncharacterized repeat protein (TIGR02543 family)
MKNLFFSFPLCTLLLFVFCNNPEIAAPDSPSRKAVAVAVLAEAQALSTYRVTISGPGMDTIGPDEYAGGQTIELYVPEGTARAFYFERYDQDAVLTDTGTTVSDIGSGMNTISVTLKSVATSLPAYTVTYDGNGNTGGSVPSPQTKIQGVGLTLAGNTGNLVKTGYNFTGWNTAEDGSGTDYPVGASYTADANVTLYAKWTSSEIVGGPTVTDADGNVYTSVIIGSQIWTLENLRTTKYNDGTVIPRVPGGTQWSDLSTPGFCWYANSTIAAERQKWGALYNWYAVQTGKLAPAGWRVPTDEDWTTLQEYLVANGYNHDGTTSGNKIAKAMAAESEWQSSTTTGVIGNDLSSNNGSGFAALPGGYRDDQGNFKSQNDYGYWWTSTINTAPNAWARYLYSDGEYLARYYDTMKHGFSVRLVRDHN